MRSLTIMAAIALAFGAMAVWGVRVWVEGQAAEQTAAVPAPPQATIIVARHDLDIGELIASDDLREIPWHAESTPEGALLDLARLSGRGDVYAAVPIAALEPILERKLADTLDALPAAYRLAPGRKAMTIRLEEVGLTDRMLRVGDRIDVLMTQLPRGGEEEAFVDVILQDIKVIGVSAPDEPGPDSRPPRATTLEVTTEEAQILTLAKRAGNLSFVLRGSQTLGRIEAKRIALSDIGAGPAQPPEPVAAPQPKPEPEPETEPAPPMASIVVNRNGGRAVYDVNIAQ